VSMLESARKSTRLTSMAGKPKSAAECFGVRPIVWIVIALSVPAVFFLYHSTEPEEPRVTKASGDAQAQVTRPPPPSRVQPSVSGVRAEPTMVLSVPQSAAEVALVGPDPRAREPIPVLINELFSPDPEARMLAALRLSRRSLYATEAVPVLKKLSRDEPDPEVRQVMKEAILNIRGHVPAPFQFAIPKNKDAR
jgi:hypothetical protein